jgi:hypothetical protein
MRVTKKTKGQISMFELDLSQVEKPKAGFHPGVNREVVESSTTDKKNRTYKVWELRIQLGLPKSDGTPFIVSRRWALSPRGVGILLEDIKQWRSGKEIKAEELEKFNPVVEFAGKSCIATVAHVNEKGRSVARVTGFVPDPENRVKLPAALQNNTGGEALQIDQDATAEESAKTSAPMPTAPLAE